MDAELLRQQLNAGLINSDVILSGAKLVGDTDHESTSFRDPRYLPFYYHLGKQLQPKVVYQIGAKLGLVGAAFMKSCKSVTDWIAMDEDRNHRAMVITSNLRLNENPAYRTTEYQSGYMGLNDSMLDIKNEHTEAFPGCDMSFLSEDFGKDRYLRHLNFLWMILKPEGLLVADYITANDAFHEFCRVKNREPMIFETRYGVGIVQR